VVAICTPRFKIKILHLAHRVFVCLYGSQTVSDFFLYTMHWLVFINEIVCVYCAVRTESFN